MVTNESISMKNGLQIYVSCGQPHAKLHCLHVLYGLLFLTNRLLLSSLAGVYSQISI